MNDAPTMLWQPKSAPAEIDLGDDLLARGLIVATQLQTARRVATATSAAIADVLLSQGSVDETALRTVQAERLGIALELPTLAQCDPQALALLDADFCRKHSVLPIRFSGSRLTLGIADPNDIFLLDQVRRKTRKTLHAVLTPASHIKTVLDSGQAAPDATQIDQILKDMASIDVQVVEETAPDESADLERLASESPIIRFVNCVLSDALRQGASDIHLEPRETAVKIRYRIDGALFDQAAPPAAMHSAIVSRLKIMANLDIAERRLPQDGRIRAIIEQRKIDLRLSTLPTAYGEKVVMRILDDRAIRVELDQLGFGPQALTLWKRQIDQPHGIVLVTGPTGSGKTTTLYASLRQMDSGRLNISTVEDPIEYQLATVNQTQTHEKIGMTFAKALRALLRQDPDVVMLGEIRDPETATIAVQAALTGHLVLSTLHTNDAPGSITRLINIGVEPYLISAAVNAILAQRLVRKICPHCRDVQVPTEELQQFLELQGFGTTQLFKGRGCDRCRQTGYSGRLGIYEMLVIDDTLRDYITTNPDVNQLRKLCRERGLVTLRDDGLDKVKAGLTTVDEILRVTASAA